jgi:hypothetical protein
MLKIDFYTVEYSSAIRATGRLILYSGSYWVIPKGVWEYDWDDDRVEVGPIALKCEHQVGRLN